MLNLKADITHKNVKKICQTLHKRRNFYAAGTLLLQQGASVNCRDLTAAVVKKKNPTACII